jgi:hypothetical protein
MTTRKPCLPWHNPLLHLVDDKSYTHSTVVAITGPKRSGKSLLLARLLGYDLIIGRTVWSTMPVHTPSFLIKKGCPRLTTEVINWDKLYLLDKDYEEGTIGIDESIYWDDSRTSLSMRNKLLNTVMNQVGHRNLNVYYTVKTQGWLDRRLQFETDIEIRCFDLAMTPWGRSNHVKRGTVIRLEFYDKSGAFTGKQYNDKYNFRPFKSLIWTRADRWWDAYNTKELVGLEEMFTGVKVDMRQRVISNKASYDSEVEDALYNLASEFLSRGCEEAQCDTYWTMARDQGIPGDPRQLGKYLKPLKIGRKQKADGNYYYTFKNMLKKT